MNVTQQQHCFPLDTPVAAVQPLQMRYPHPCHMRPQQELVDDTRRFAIVVDTSAFLNHLSTLLMLKTLYRVCISIPMTVFYELDGLKSGSSEVAPEAREVIRILNEWLHADDDSCIFQLHTDVVSNVIRHMPRQLYDTCKADGSFVNWAHYLLRNKEMFNIYGVAIMSNDINLCSISMLHNVPAKTSENIKSKLMMSHVGASDHHESVCAFFSAKK